MKKSLSRVIAVAAALLMLVSAMSVTALAADHSSQAASGNDASGDTTLISTYTPAQKPETVRLGGADRFGTAVKIGAEGWEKADTVVIANAFNYADALAGAPLAYALDAPVLLSYKEYIPRDITAEISRLGAKKAIILGGAAAVSTEAESVLKDAGIEVTRIWGQDRYETAGKIAEALRKATGKLSEVFIASGVNYPDALSASSAAALKKAPIVYSPANGNLKGDTVTFIKTAGIKTAYILGGEAAVGKNAQTKLTEAGVGSVTRLGGSDRYDTSLKIASRFDDLFKSGDVAFATGKNFPDALAGSVLAAKKSVPVLLTDNATVRDDVKAYTGKKKISKVYVFGGKSVVSDDIINGYFSSPAEIKEGASVEDGKLVIRVAVSDGGLAWAADEMAQDNTVLKYDGSEVKDGFFTARYTPAGDGVMAVYARHYYNNTICDEQRSWSVTVKNGKITDISAGTVKKSPDEASQDAKLSGAWIEDETEFTNMTVEKNESRGWNVTVNAPMTHGAYVFKATVYYDCEIDAFAYNKGKFFALNTDGTYNSEAAVAGAEGSFKLGGTDKEPTLVWHSSDDRAKDFVSKDIKYVRVPANEIKEGASVEDGKLVIRVAAPDGGLAWTADEMAQDNTVLKYDGSEVKDGFFTARYSPAGDGKMAVHAYHYYTACACDEMRTWEIEVKKGSVSDISEVNIKKNPADDKLDSMISGFWKEDKTEYTNAVVSKNKSRGWDIGITAPKDHGSFIFETTVYYDCSLDAFVYDKGKFFDQPADGSDSTGEAKIAGATGSFSVTADGKLVWHNDDDRAEKYVSKDIIYVRIPVIINYDDDVKAAVYQRYNSSYPDIIEEIKYNTIKVYTKEEIAADESIKSHKIGDRDVVFEINYDLKVVDGYKDIMQFTAGSGEIKGNWVVNKSNVGILRYVSEGAYKVDAFGTGF